MKGKIMSILAIVALLLNLVGCTGQKTTTSEEEENFVTNVNFPVTSALTAEESAQRINNRLQGEIKKLSTESVRISRYDSAWAFAHHGFIAEFKGSLYAMWSSGHENEDDLGQRVMYAKSTNFKEWSVPEALADSMQGISSENVLFPMGFFVNGDTLIAYYKRCEYDYTKLRNDYTLRPDSDTGWLYTKYYYMTTTDGETWTDPIEFHARNAGIAQARQNKTGRWIWSGGTGIAYSDTGDGITGWITTEIQRSDLDSAYQNGAVQLCEANWYQTDDYVMHLLMRSNAGYLWQSESYDNGESWSAAYPTQFTDDNTMCYIGTLPDGRYYYVGSPVYSGSDARSPLMLCISEDGYNFSEQYILCDSDYAMQKPGFAKCGGYGYPECCIYDGYVYIIYSLGKEVMEVTRFKLSDLSNASAQQAARTPEAPAWLLDFSDAAATSAATAEGDTELSFDSDVGALKVTATGSSDPATVVLNEISEQGIAFTEYPVMALRVKKSGYRQLNTGAMYFSIGTKGWMQFKSPKYNHQVSEEEEWITIAVDLRASQNYYDNAYSDLNISKLNDAWSGLKLGLAYREYASQGDAFYVKAIGLFRTVYDAQMYFFARN